jgi:hypothetical protein
MRPQKQDICLDFNKSLACIKVGKRDGHRLIVFSKACRLMYSYQTKTNLGSVFFVTVCSHGHEEAV